MIGHHLIILWIGNRQLGDVRLFLFVGHTSLLYSAAKLHRIYKVSRREGRAIIWRVERTEVEFIKVI